jgi:hypothetical protein
MPYQPKQVQTRPNEVCLCCDGELKEPNYQRSFFTCSKACNLSLSKGISALSMDSIGSRRKFSKNGWELAVCYFILREAHEPLSGKQIMERARDIFGKKVRFKSKDFNHVFFYYDGTVLKTKERGRNVFRISDKSIPFNQSVRPKYAERLFPQGSNTC